MLWIFQTIEGKTLTYSIYSRWLHYEKVYGVPRCLIIMSSGLVYIVTTLGAFTILLNPKACIRWQVLLHWFIISSDNVVLCFAPPQRWFCPLWPSCNPATQQLCVWLPRETLLSLSGHMTWINKTSWPLFPAPGSPHRNRYSRFLDGGRECERKSASFLPIESRRWGKGFGTENRAPKMTCNCMSACTRVWNLFSHHLRPRKNITFPSTI